MNKFAYLLTFLLSSLQA